MNKVPVVISEEEYKALMMLAYCYIRIRRCPKWVFDCLAEKWDELGLKTNNALNITTIGKSSSQILICVLGMVAEMGIGWYIKEEC